MVMEQISQDFSNVLVLDLTRTGGKRGAEDYPSRQASTIMSGSRYITIPSDLSLRVRQLASNDQRIMFAILAGAFQIVLTRLDLCPVQDESDGIVSFLAAEPIPVAESGTAAGIILRLRLQSGRTFRECLDQIDGQANPGRDFVAGVSAASLEVIDADIPAFAIVRNEHEGPLAITEHRQRSCAFFLALQRKDGDLAGVLRYDGVRIDEQCAARVETCYLHFLREALLDVDRPVSEIGLWDATAGAFITGLGKGRHVERPENLTIVQMFEAQAKATPQNEAIQALLELDNMYDPATRKYVVESVTYAQLNARANQIARMLVAKGVGSGCIVGVAVAHPIHKMEAVFGVLKAGAAFVPIDGRIPGDLKKEMLAAAGVRLALFEADIQEPLSLPEGIALLDAKGATVNAQSTDNLEQRSGPQDPCYVYFTSGTTSRMKGVVALHRGLLNYSEWRREALGFSDRSVTLQLVPFSADGFGSNAYPTLSSGGSLVIVPDNRLNDAAYILATLERFPISTMSLVPSSCEIWIAQVTAHHLRQLQRIVLAGETASDDLLRRLSEVASQSGISNEYGPTEATIGSTFCASIGVGSARIVGRPIDNVSVVVLGRNDELMPPGVPGEICIAGAGLMYGYVGDEANSARSFAVGRDDGPFYRTGDRGTWTSEGYLKYLGRFDRQAKVRGHRIELAYLERRMGEILDAEVHVCLHHGDQSPRATHHSDDVLVAYIATQRSRSSRELRSALEVDLPDWMIPSFLMVVSSLPKDERGRIVKHALPVVWPQEDDEQAKPPMTAMEARVADLFAQVLRLQPAHIGRDANFFSLGGHSIALTRLAALIHSVCRVNIKMSQIFHSPTVESVARLVAERGRTSPERMARTETRDVYPASPVQEQLFVARHRGGHPTAYNTPVFLDLGHGVDPERLRRAAEQLIARHEVLRTAFVASGDHVDQKIRPPMPVELEVRTATTHLAQSVLDGFVRPFDLSSPPLLRIGLLLVANQIEVVVVDSHHIVMDARSLSIVLRELGQLYRGETLELQRYSYKDYSEWQRSAARGQQVKATEDFWLDRFSEGVPVLDLPIDHARPRALSLLGDLAKTTLDGKLAQKLRGLAKSNNATASALYLSAFVMLLAKWTGQSDFAVGLSVSGRLRPELENIIGNFASAVPLRCELDDAMPFRKLLHKLQSASIQAYENQDYSLSQLVKRLGVRPDTSRHAMFNTLFQYVRSEEDAMPELLTALPLADGTELNLPENYVYDLVLDVVETRNFTTIKLGYCAELFDRRTILLLLEDLAVLLKLICDDQDLSLEEVELAAAAKRAALVSTGAEGTDFTF
ncbi:condensation domain-containing protein [Rhizobium laguerreae]|uniref:condensation domain-containing protein n=1 Tax=Rhizobium laguerreae TaxID=1076926 RepID=UPI001C90DFD3|nr:condensation domain-containing protein [Rhizobium laguerreae]MBY3203460.1 AMP-binding protein [Rhizobium laguerreae]